jgi:hypothetical protein
MGWGGKKVMKTTEHYASIRWTGSKSVVMVCIWSSADFIPNSHSSVERAELRLPPPTRALKLKNARAGS